MPAFETLCAQIKAVLVDVLELDLAPEEIRDDDALFSHGLGVDSAEALEIVTAVEARFGIRIDEDQIGLAMFQDVRSIAEVVETALTRALPLSPVRGA